GNRAHRLLARNPARDRRRRRLVRRTSVVPIGREQFLVLQFAPRAAGLRDLPRGATPARRANAANRGNRGPTHETARGRSRGLRRHDLRRRAAGGGGDLAAYGSVARRSRGGISKSPGGGGAGQYRRAGRYVSRGGPAHLGDPPS